MFTVIWRGLAEKWGNKNAEEGAEIKGAFDGDEDRWERNYSLLVHIIDGSRSDVPVPLYLGTENEEFGK